MKTMIKIEFEEKEYITLSFAICGACANVFKRIREFDDDDVSVYTMYDALNCIESNLSLLRKMPIIPDTIEELYEEIECEFRGLLSTIDKKDYRKYCIENNMYYE